jgi:ABC-type transport system involved in multi-copper enzyme maturation permease subunit
VVTELEQRSWVYLATRPNGIFWLLLGKYLVAATWGVSAAWLGVSVSIALTNVSSPMQICLALMALSFLSCISYSAIFLLIGVIFPKRAMVFCVMYAAFVEVILGVIPALVNRLTIQYRLRSLLVQWVPTNQGVRNHPAFAYVFGDDRAVLHILWIVALIVVFLTAAIVTAHRKEFTTASEGDL